MPRRIVLTLLALLLWIVPAGLGVASDGTSNPAADESSYSGTFHVENTPSSRVQATLVFEVDTPQLLARTWEVYAPVLPELPSQSGTQSLMTVADADVRPELITEQSPLRRGVMRVVVPVNGAQVSQKLIATVTYEATMHARRLMPGAPEKPVAKLQPAEEQAWLARSRRLDFSSPTFQQWLTDNDLRRKSSETDLAFAFRVYQLIRKQYQYDYDQSQDRAASLLCGQSKTDCGGLCGLLVAALRANRVPARMLAGRLIDSGDPTTQDPLKHKRIHVVCEFFASGVGWVPVEMAGAVSNKTQPARNTFGWSSGRVLAMHVDPGFVVPTVLFGPKSFDLFQTPYYWVRGQGHFEPHTVGDEWTVTVTPILKSAPAEKQPAAAAAG